MRITSSLCCIRSVVVKNLGFRPYVIRERLINHSRHLRGGVFTVHVLSRMRFFCYVTNAYIFLKCFAVTYKFIVLSLKSREISCNSVCKECLFENSMSLYVYYPPKQTTAQRDRGFLSLFL